MFRVICLGDKRGDIILTSLVEFDMFVLHQTLVEISERCEDVSIGLHNHDCFVSLVLAAFQVLKMVCSVWYMYVMKILKYRVRRCYKLLTSFVHLLRVT